RPALGTTNPLRKQSPPRAKIGQRTKSRTRRSGGSCQVNSSIGHLSWAAVGVKQREDGAKVILPAKAFHEAKVVLEMNYECERRRLAANSHAKAGGGISTRGNLSLRITRVGRSAWRQRR